MAKAVVTNTEDVTVEVLASEIQKLSRSAIALTNSRLKSKTILILLSHSSGLGQRDVQKVLDALAWLENDYLKAPAKK